MEPGVQKRRAAQDARDARHRWLWRASWEVAASEAGGAGSSQGPPPAQGWAGPLGTRQKVTFPGLRPGLTGGPAGPGSRQLGPRRARTSSGSRRPPGWSRRCSRSERPRKSSITMKSRPSSLVSTSCTSTARGVSRRMTARASFKKRRCETGSDWCSGWMTLMARSARARRWVASYTAPNPPLPSRRTRWYLPAIICPLRSSSSRGGIGLDDSLLTARS